MSSIIYNIPVGFLSQYNGRNLIVRAQDPAELVSALTGELLNRITGVQLLSLSADIAGLSAWGSGIPIELVVTNPETEFAQLYHFAKLLDKHPLRVLIPATPGFSRAVKVAASLQMSIKLDVGQPDPRVVSELSKVLEFFLQDPLEASLIQFFQGFLMARVNEEPVTMWEIQEEDPSLVRYVTDDGTETIARLPRNGDIVGRIDSFIDDFKLRLFLSRSECYSCDFFGNCAGYFKWPLPDYRCDGVKLIFRNLKNAAKELPADLASVKAQKAG